MLKPNYLLILVISVFKTGYSVVLFPQNTFGVTSKDKYILANFDEPFEVDCVSGENDLGHPDWYFTRDQWKRDLFQESGKKSDGVYYF